MDCSLSFDVVLLGFRTDLKTKNVLSYAFNRNSIPEHRPSGLSLSILARSMKIFV